jgi:indole-3-glycerol phosphate synthase/phosphoribosylanthranilate isomerase
MSASGSVLDQILARTRERLAERKRAFPLERVMAGAPTPRGRRSFLEALARPGGPNLIAEFKRRSPSRGPIREDLHPVRVAQGYEIAGAAALSIVTEPDFFGGNLDDLAEARAATLLPTLCKDFILDPYQVWEAWYAGADAVLLIVAALSDRELAELTAVAHDAQLDRLFEVHDAGELRRALAAGARIVGVNNRDLRTLEVDLRTSFALAPLIPDEVLAVSESGIRSGEDIRRLREAGFDAFLVGESLMSAPDPGDALDALIRSASGSGATQSPAPVRVKVCGLTSVEDALDAVRAGADAIGLVLWPGSSRAVDLDRARRIAHALPPFVLRVGVFVDATREELLRAADTLGLDLLQLHGAQAPESLSGLPRRVLKAVRVGPGFRPEDALRYEGRAAGLLLDSRDPAAPAGSGGRFDWKQALAVRAGSAFLALAGGLRPDNVAEAIRAVHPDAVDVSSGVESAPGRKDPALIRAFVQAVRSTGR